MRLNKKNVLGIHLSALENGVRDAGGELQANVGVLPSNVASVSLPPPSSPLIADHHFIGVHRFPPGMMEGK